MSNHSLNNKTPNNADKKNNKKHKPNTLNKHSNSMNNKSLKIATLNVRTLKGLEKLTELESALVNSNIDVLGIAEVRRDGEAISMTKNKNLLCYKGIEGGQKGVGFIIKGSLAKNLLEFIGISERIALLRLKMGKNQITLIQVYAPTSTSDEKEHKKFYKDLKDTGHL